MITLHIHIPDGLVVRICAYQPQGPGFDSQTEQYFWKWKRITLTCLMDNNDKNKKRKKKQDRAKPRKRIKRSIAYMWFFSSFITYSFHCSYFLFLSSLSLLIVFNFKCFSLNCCSALLLGHEQNASAGTSEAWTKTLLAVKRTKNKNKKNTHETNTPLWVVRKNRTKPILIFES